MKSLCARCGEMKVLNSKKVCNSCSYNILLVNKQIFKKEMFADQSEDIVRITMDMASDKWNKLQKELCL